MISLILTIQVKLVSFTSNCPAKKVHFCTTDQAEQPHEILSIDEIHTMIKSHGSPYITKFGCTIFAVTSFNQ